jgi:excisionase family DNA binding protein
VGVSPTDVDALLSPAEVAEMLRVSPGSVYRWVKAGRLPHFRTPGNQLRFRRVDVERLMAPETGTGGEAA